MHAPRDAPRGFTLIELLTVIAIIGILAAIIIPTVGQVRRSARTAQGLSNLRQIGVGLRLYAEENKGNLPEFKGTTAEDSGKPWHQIARAQLGLRNTPGTSQSLLVCPNGPIPVAGGDRSNNSVHIWPFRQKTDPAHPMRSPPFLAACLLAAAPVATSAAVLFFDSFTEAPRWSIQVKKHYDSSAPAFPSLGAFGADGLTLTVSNGQSTLAHQMIAAVCAADGSLSWTDKPAEVVYAFEVRHEQRPAPLNDEAGYELRFGLVGSPTRDAAPAAADLYPPIDYFAADALILRIVDVARDGDRANYAEIRIKTAMPDTGIANPEVDEAGGLLGGAYTDTLVGKWSLHLDPVRQVVSYTTPAGARSPDFALPASAAARFVHVRPYFQFSNNLSCGGGSVTLSALDVQTRP